MYAELQFSQDTDSFFDLISHDSENWKKTAILDIVFLEPTIKNYKKLKIELKRLTKLDGLYELNIVIKKIDNNEYKREFMFKKNSHSIISELFSFLCQAITYYD